MDTVDARSDARAAPDEDTPPYNQDLAAGRRIPTGFRYPGIHPSMPGWHACLDLLAHEVGGTTAPWTSAERWGEIHSAYVDRFGPEAATIGPPGG